MPLGGETRLGGLSVTGTTLLDVADASVGRAVRFASADSADGGRRVGEAPSAGGAARTRPTPREVALPRTPPATLTGLRDSRKNTRRHYASRSRETSAWKQLFPSLRRVQVRYGPQSVQTRRCGYTVTHRSFFFFSC